MVEKNKVKLEPVWFVYLIRTKTGSLYCGVTNNVERRFLQHQTGKGAKALRGKGPLILEWNQKVGDKSSALRIEYRLKKLPKMKKERLVTEQLGYESFISIEDIC